MVPGSRESIGTDGSLVVFLVNCAERALPIMSRITIPWTPALAHLISVVYLPGVVAVLLSVRYLLRTPYL